MTTFLALWVVFSGALGMLAKQRGRSFLVWMLVGIAISPLLGFVVLMMAKDLALAEALDTVTHDMDLTHVKCPHCAEYVLPEASVCPYCRGKLTPNPEFVKERVAAKLAEEEELQASRQYNFIIGIGIVVAISILAWLSTYLK